jgi:hypothetical protein
MRKLLGLALLGILAAAAPARADIERKATIGCDVNGNGQICFYIWPALPGLPGWHQDQAASYHYSANILVPDGQNFANAPIALTGNVVAEDGYKTDHPRANAVDGFIEDDIANTRRDNPDAEVTEVEGATAADGRKLRVFVFHKLKGGHVQALTYTEDGDHDGKFFVMLMLDSLTDEGLETGMPVFRQMVGKYKHWKAS